jgi:RNA polymerase sigma factor (sigma-70 family)
MYHRPSPNPDGPDPGHEALAGPPRGALERDRHLLRRWRAGDHDAGLELLDHYAALERVVAFRLGVRSPQAMLDLHQDLVLRMLARLPTLAEEIETSFAGWLSWQVRDLARKHHRPARAPTRASDMQREPDGFDPAEGAMAWEAISLCRERLPPREREVFELRYLEGLSLQEVAERLTSNANAVAQSVFRLVRRMRACLRVQGFDLRGREA